MKFRLCHKEHKYAVFKLRKHTEVHRVCVENLEPILVWKKEEKETAENDEWSSDLVAAFPVHLPV